MAVLGEKHLRTPTTTTACGRTLPWAKTRRWAVVFRIPAGSRLWRTWADFIINMSGHSFR
jgi:hypothetical protein